MKKLHILFILPFIIYTSVWSQTKMVNVDSLIECPAILESAFISGTKASEGKFNYEFTVKTLGDINITSGKIIASCPIRLWDSEPFEQIFPVGKFPVELAITRDSVNRKVAYARIKFSNNKVIRWKVASYIAQKQHSIYDSSNNCYPVDDGFGSLMDTESKESCGLYENYNNREQLKSKFNETNWTGFLLQNGMNNAAHFTVRQGDGCYVTYIGYDANGNICRLLTDLQLISWWKHKR